MNRHERNSTQAEEGFAMNTELIRKLHAWATAYESGVSSGEPTDADYAEHAKILRDAIAAISAQSPTEERCESGSDACGPVERHDSEGVPLCRKCYDSLLDEAGQ